MEKEELVQLLHKNRLTLQVKPNAKNTEILKWDGEKLHIAVRAPPEKNKANKEILQFLSRKMKRQCRFVRGMHTREKVVEYL